MLPSVKDAEGHVIFGPKSVRKDESFTLPDDRRAAVVVEVVRLENLLAGGDFGEFRVKGAAGQVSGAAR